MKKRILYLSLVLMLLGAFCLTSCNRVKADLVLYNGKIATVDDSNSIHQAVAVCGNKIHAVGTDNEIKKFIGSETKAIDLDSKLVIPGLIDSHGHFFSMGNALLTLDLTETKSWKDIVEKVKNEVKNRKPGELIRGRGWHQEKWDKVPKKNVEGLPFHTHLSEISLDNPVILFHASGHSCFANKKAMELANINKGTKSPEGGEIVKDSKGNPIGVFRENAMRLLKISDAYQGASKEIDNREKIFTTALNECLKKGITGFHDAAVSFETIKFYKKLLDAGKLKIRMNVMVSESNEVLKNEIQNYRIKSEDTNYFLLVRTIKRFIDGALGSHGAWFLKPYESLPASTGLNTEPIDKMKEVALIAIKNNFQLATHAIGDRGNRETLDIYIDTFKQFPKKKDLRWRIEHSQHLNPTDIPRFGKYGIIASMQGIHCTSDGPWVFKRLGEKRAKEGAYVWRKLMDTGALICNGTDVPVEKIDPMPGFYALITRKMKDGTPFYPDQTMTRNEALRSYTLNGAYSSYEEDIKGSIEVGKLADMVILSKDLLTVDESEILNIEVLYTIIDGKIVYQK